MGAEIILTTQFNVSQSWDSGILDYLDREDKKLFQDKVIKFEDINVNGQEGSRSIEKEAHQIASSKVSDMGEFSRFLDYMDREKAVLNKSKLSEDEKAQLKVINLLKNECKERITITIIEDKEFNQTSMFSSSINNFSIDDKDLFKNRFALAENAGANLWKDVVSFETDFLIKQGLYDPAKNQLDTKRLIEASRKMMGDYFKKENLEDTGFWVGEIHYNTEHFHIHFATSEVKNTRKIQELELKNGKVVLAPRGKRKQSTIDSMKHTFMNELVDRDMELNKQSELRNNLVQEIKNRLQRNQNQEAVNLLESLEKKLPKNKRKWNSKNIFKDRETKQLMIRLIDHQMKDSKLFSDFKNQIREEHAARQQMYGKSNQRKNNYYQNRLEDIYYRLSNSILSEMKKGKELNQEQPVDSFDKAKNWLIERLENTNNLDKSKELKMEDNPRKNQDQLVGKKFLNQTEPSANDLEAFLDFDFDKQPSTIKSAFRNHQSTVQSFVNRKENFENNLDEFSINNQRLIVEQKKDATCVHSQFYWMAQGRKVMDHEKGIVINAPVFENEGDAKPAYFEEVKIYDISQTIPFEKKVSNEYVDKKEQFSTAFSQMKKDLAKNERNNIKTFSQGNQKRIKEQYPLATQVHNEFYWLANKRKIKENERPIQIIAPVIKDKKVVEFVTHSVYDINQTETFKNDREWEFSVHKKMREETQGQPQLVGKKFRNGNVYLDKNSKMTKEQYLEKSKMGYKLKNKSLNALKQEMTTNDDYERQKALWEHEQINRKVEYKKKQQEWELS